MSLARILSILFIGFTALVTAQRNGTAHGNSTASYRYYNNKTAPYFVEKWPLVDFPTGEFYSGNVAINESDPSRTFFFVFKPADQAGPVNETTIWFNGGPGCSSLTGFLIENGPISWQPGTLKPVENPYAWSRLTNMLWVEYPLGVGFTTGNITAHNEVDTARDFVGFFKNWQELFDIRNYKTYVTGESYAGRYVPSVAAEMLEQKDKTYFDVGGALIYEGTIGEVFEVQENIPLYPFIEANNNIFNLNESYLLTLEDIHLKCGHQDYLDKYLQFPPPGPQPTVNASSDDESCNLYTPFTIAWGEVNPCASPYEITQGCPFEYDPLAVYPGYDTQAYFNRADVRAAIHAPKNFGHDVDVPQLNTEWLQCGVFATAPFLNNVDESPNPNLAVLPKVIEATNRVLLHNGDFDAVVLTNGSLLAIQNMTWNGQLGFQQAPSADFVVPNQGVLGKKHFERGLMFVEGYATGHMAPVQQPRASLRHLEWMLGRIDDL